MYSSAVLAPQPRHELQIVDHQKPNVVLALPPPGAGANLRNGNASGLVEANGRRLELLRDGNDPVVFFGAEISPPHPMRGNARVLSKQTESDLLGRHLDGEESDRSSVLGSMAGDVRGQSALAHAWAPGNYYKLRWNQTPELRIQ